MVSPAHEKCREVRITFWKRTLQQDAPFPETLRKRVEEPAPFPGWALDILPDDGKELRVLDVNAGPISAIGTRAEGRSIRLTAIDGLARDYQALLRPHGIEPLVGTEFCSPEDVVATFGESAFDLIYSYNGLDFTEDPIATYRQLVQGLKAHGRIVTFHEVVEDPQRIQDEWYRYFHCLRDGRVVIRQRGYQRDLQDGLWPNRVEWRLENNLLMLVISPGNPGDRAVSLPRPEPRGKEPPALVSMHLPKTAGSSFRQFLEDLYGPRLRCMYTEAETAPRLVEAVELDPGTSCLHGHFQADAFERHLPGALKVTWMRDPVERVVSSYFQYLRHPESASESVFNEKIFRHGYGLMDFARSDEIRRQIRWYFNAVPLEAFFFIGITERYEESLRLLGRLLDCPLPDSGPANNVNPDKHIENRYSLTASQRGELEALYAEEQALYRYANYRLDAQLEDPGA